MSPRDRYRGPGGGLYTGPGRAVHWTGRRSLHGGGLYTGPGGGLYTGPEGGLYTGPGGGLHTGPDGGLYTGPGGGLYTGPGGELYTGPCDEPYKSNRAPLVMFVQYLDRKGKDFHRGPIAPLCLRRVSGRPSDMAYDDNAFDVRLRVRNCEDDLQGKDVVIDLRTKAVARRLGQIQSISP